MNYCRVGQDSDVGVISTEDGFSCVGCATAKGPFKTRKDIYNHLVQHVYAKDKVPDDVLRKLLAEHQEEVKAIREAWTPEEAQALLDKLTLYFGEPVKPIGRYCDAFKVWKGAVEDAYRKAAPETHEKRRYERMTAVIREVDLLVSKSNLLARLLYEGEQLRSEPCPIHKGQWSGCAWGDNRCPHCMSGDNVTGWVDPAASASV